jgi:hypothetical protein
MACKGKTFCNNFEGLKQLLKSQEADNHFKKSMNVVFLFQACPTTFSLSHLVRLFL